MDQLIEQVIETARGMWRRRWTGVLVAWIVGVAGAIGLTLMPDIHEASARVYVDTKTVLRPLLRDLAVEPDLDQTVGLLARTLITRPNVEKLLNKSSPETAKMPAAERERAVDSLQRDIRISANGRDNVFSFSYRDTEPAHASLVVQNLVAMFLDSDIGTKRRDAEAARAFIDDQIKSLEARLAEAENRLKDFKLRNLGVADLSGKDYFTRMSTLTEELAKQTVELRAAEQSRDALRRELSGETMTLVPDTLPTAPSPQVSEYDARLEAQRKLLDDLLRRYTDLHPDVVTTKRLIARLEEQRQQEVEARRRAVEAKPAHASGQAQTSNVMQQVKLALAEAEGHVASLRVRTADTQSRLSQLRAAATRVPQVEAEMVQLNRDYDVIRKNYETMVSRREKASLSEDVDATRSAQFRVIDPPRTAQQAVFPNRVALAPAVLLLALLAGVAAAFLVAQLMPTFDNARMLRLATRRPVLGNVSRMVNDGMLQRARRDLLAFGSALGGLAIVAGVWIAWVSMQARVA